MKSRIMMMLLVFVFIGSGISICVGPPHDEGEHAVGFPPVNAIEEELQLTKEQKEVIEEQRYQDRREGVRIESELRLKMLDLQHELKKTKMDDKKIDRLIDETGDLHKEKMKFQVDGIRNLRKILTDEQWEKFSEMKDKRHRKYNKETGDKLKKRMKDK
ncbi:MAG: Spy/CpxP family protein refolding chaperone [Elusimicrobiota bacterium]